MSTTTGPPAPSSTPRRRNQPELALVPPLPAVGATGTRGAAGRWAATLASEGAAGYATPQDVDAPDTVASAPTGVAGGVGSPWEGVLAGLGVATDAATEVDLDGLSEPEVKDWLAGLQQQLDRLEGVRRRSAGVLRARAVRRQGPGNESRARREVDDFLTGKLRLSPTDAKRTSNAGRDLAGNPTLAGAVEDGRLRPDHANVIADASRELDPTLAGEVEQTLTEAAAEQDPTELGRTARRLLAEVAPETAEQAQERSVQRRYARVAPQADGSLLINARVAAGIDAETAQSWFDKYRTADADDEHRTPEQRTCDAMLTGMRAGLDDPCGPTVQGVSPHVTVLVTLADLVAGIGTGEATWSGPITMAEVRRLLRNASLSTIVLDDQQLPLVCRKARQQVSNGLWRALVARDGGCRMPGCTAPPSWCDVAHGSSAARDGGVLSLANAVLLCRRHHRQVDQPGWSIRIDGATIDFHAPNGRTIRAGPPHRTGLATTRAGRPAARTSAGTDAAAAASPSEASRATTAASPSEATRATTAASPSEATRAATGARASEGTRAAIGARTGMGAGEGRSGPAPPSSPPPEQPRPERSLPSRPPSERPPSERPPPEQLPTSVRQPSLIDDP
jgi:hypothetical protein